MFCCLKGVGNLFIAFITLLFFAFPIISNGQSLGDPIVNITFGSGTDRYAGPLAPDSGSTTYTYFQNNGTVGQTFPQDGQYTIVNTSLGMLNNLWVVTSDHTGNSGGYFMLVNAANTPGLFYTRKVTALCAGTKYQFGAFIKNLFINGSGNPPNVTFRIETESGQEITSYTTGNIAADGQWNAYNTEFTTPPNTGVIVLKMINNGPGGFGNDLAIDDITFRAYGDPVQVVFDQSSVTQVCAGNSQTIVIKSVTPPASGYSQKIQQKVNGAWVDIAANVSGNIYSFSSPTAAGTYNYRVVSGLSANIGNSQCVVASNELVFTVLPLPTTAFTMPLNSCPGNQVTFQDNSSPNGTIITSWLWNFGDGQTSTQQSPVHIYNNPGTYNVTLKLTCNNGCAVTPLTKQIKINELPVANFTISAAACATKPVTFIDGSIIPTGVTVTSRKWEIDGFEINPSSPELFNYVFTNADTYTIKLTVLLSTNCTAEISKQLTVHPLPVVDFDTPPTCVSDNTTFTNRTTIADNSSLSYLWDFGDGTPKSTQQSPEHKYQNTGDYEITLTVTSALSNCSEVVKKPFRVNGSTPRADFAVINSNNLYSNTEVNIQNNSSVDVFGDITRVELYYDYLNNPTLVEIDNSPTPGKLYHHLYPEFHSGTKQYTLRMLAYSGTVCVSVEKTDVITVLATPLVAFAQPAPVCQNEGMVQFNGRDESNSGLAGTGTYSGVGVSSSGLFDPIVAGPGTFNIKYTYTFATGAANSVSRDITVYPTPTIDLPSGITILEGGSGILKGRATGSGLSYSWYPTTGLNNANIADPTITIINDATYTLTVTNSNGCKQTADIAVKVLKQPVVPNTFTPNGDGFNDNWEIKYLNTYPGCTVNVFNRAGQTVYKSVGYAQPWDGRVGGNELGLGVYYYIIDPKNGRKAFSGYITIVK